MRCVSEPKSQLKKITDFTGIKFRFHDLRRTFATHAEANGVPFDLIRRALNHKSRSVTEGYIITQIDTLRPVFDAVADGYHRYYDPDWEHQARVDQAVAEEMKTPSGRKRVRKQAKKLRKKLDKALPVKGEGTG